MLRETKKYFSITSIRNFDKFKRLTIFLLCLFISTHVIGSELDTLHKKRSWIGGVPHSIPKKLKRARHATTDRCETTNTIKIMGYIPSFSVHEIITGEGNKKLKFISGYFPCEYNFFLVRMYDPLLIQGKLLTGIEDYRLIESHCQLELDAYNEKTGYFRYKFTLFDFKLTDNHKPEDIELNACLTFNNNDKPYTYIEGIILKDTHGNIKLKNLRSRDSLFTLHYSKMFIEDDTNKEYGPDAIYLKNINYQIPVTLHAKI